MSGSRITGLAALALALALAGGNAEAGRSCEQKPLSAQSVARAMALAEKTAVRLDQTGARVVVLARAGQNLSEYGLRYSHLGFAYRDGEHGPWRVVHKLNQCGSSRASLYRQGLGEFFLDDPFEFRAAIVVLDPALQAKLLPALRDDGRVAQLHTGAYNMVAYPWAQRYQQSNQWALEALALAVEPGIAERQQAQAWLGLQGYEPTVLRLGALTRLGGRISAANIAFDDHPNEKRFSDRIETVTVDSVFAWLNRSGLGGPVQVIR
jgi:hypothetical protein